jgi:hypothetical protein
MPPPTDAEPAPAFRHDGLELLRGRLMQESLTRLLDRVRGSREVLPHLAALEISLGKSGTSVIADIAPHWLAKICSQLSSLPLPAQDPALHDLLSRLMDVMEGQRPHSHYRSGFDSRLMVDEASHTDFAAASAEQATTQRGSI